MQLAGEVLTEAGKAVTPDEAAAMAASSAAPKIVELGEVGAADGLPTSAGSKIVVVETVQEMPRGLWTEDSALDRFDKMLSMNVFRLEFGQAFETMLSVPGTWFGMPVPAFILSNLLTWYHHIVEHLAEDATILIHLLESGSESAGTSMALLGVSFVFIGIWSVVFFKHWFSGHIEKAYLLNKYWTLPSIAVPVGVGRYFTARAYKAATFFIVSWFLAQAFSAAMKTAFSRTRPTVAAGTAARLKKVNRAYRTYQTMLSMGESVFESFPSGDSVGAACFSATLYLIKAPTWSVILCLVTAFGRMYFHAHHLLDVSAGLAIGWAVPLALNAAVGIDYFDLAHTAVITAFTLFFFVKLQRFKPKLPEHLVVKGRKGF